MDPTPCIRYAVLGPLTVSVGDRSVELGPPRQRTMLALLLVHANEAVSIDRVIDELWDASPPASARHAIHVYVSRLRAALHLAGAGDQPTLETTAPGYALLAPDDAIDARRAERLVDHGGRLLDAGDHAAAAETLGQALLLWRGPPFAEFAYDEFAIAEIRRLEELRLRAVELGVTAELELGRAADVVGTLRSLTSAHPTRERFWYLLMAALDRAGRPAEAVMAYRRAASELQRALGATPGPELEDLAAAIGGVHRTHRGQARGVEHPLTRR